VTARAQARLAIPPLPRLSLVLLAAAVVHVLIGFAAQRMTGGYLDISVSRVAFELRDAMPFVLGAAIIVGWDRWPAGRPWLVAAAIAFAIAATLDAGTELWLGLTWPPEPPATAGASVSADVLPVLATLALPFGPLFAAVGIWRAAPAPGHSARRLAAIASVAILAAVVMTVRLLLAIDAIRVTYALEVTEPFSGALLVANFAFTVGAGLMAVLALAAVWAAPRHYFVPEFLIAGGALTVAIASIAGEGGALLASRQVIGIGWMDWIGWTGYAELLGLLGVALGFLSARISTPGES
jgi:hypothetical protein